MVYRGSKTQYAPVVGLDNNPCWADVEELKTSKGWVFKTPTLDPEKDDGDLTFEIEILDARARTSIGAVRINPQRFRSDMRNMQGLSGDWQEEGDDRHCINLFDPEFPFNDLWLPLFKKDGENSFTLDESCTAKVHVMTLWVPKHETARRKLLPKKPHEWRTFELQHRLHSNMVRDHIDDHVEIHGNRRGYNPNAWGTQWPLSYSAACAQHIEAIHYSIPYLKCCEVYDRLSWDSFQEKLVTTPAGRPSLAKSKEEWSRSSGEEASRNANALENLIRRGIEPAMRRHHWLDLTHAEKAIEEYEAGALLPMGQGAAQSSVQGLQNFRRKYRDLVRAGRSYRSSAMLQLSEDMVGASSWEVIQMAGIMDQHLDRISRAQDICIALITFSMDNNKEANLLNYASVQATAGAGERSCGVAYSESLLVLAFHLLLAISANDPDDHKAHAGGAAAAGPTGAGAQSAQEFQQEQMVDQNRQAQLLQAKRDEEEASVFWLLYSLIGYRENQALRDYFGAYSVNHSFVEHRGAMDDCNRLNCVIARHEYDLWVKLGALGFHLSMVFYGAFMRLYATYLPPQSCFRLWDLFFSDTPKRTDRPEKPKARSCLLDVAFAVLRKCKTKLMDCQSASEAKSVLLDCMERLYDTTELIEMTYQAHFAARESMAVHVSESVGIGSHAADYARSAALWEQFLPQFRMQNAALYELTKNLKLESTIFGKMLKGIRALFASENCERATFVGMHRVVPARIRRIGPEVDQSVVGKMTSWFSRVSETVYIENLSLPVALSLPKPADINAVTCGEPTQMDSNDFERQFGRVVGADWSPFMHKIFQAFASPSERRMSTNEVFISILCCAKGTLGEKAMELFKLFAVAQPKHSMHHIHPVSHTAATVVDKVDWNNKKAEGQVTKCPAPTEYKKHALHFKVYTHSTGNQEILMGEVFIPTLRPYLWSGMDREMVTEHKMWGMEARLPPGINMTTGNAAALVRDMGVRPEIGTMAMAIKWMPSSDHKQEEGQLGIHLKHIAFSNKYVEAHRLKNPRVEVITYDEDGHEQKIKRWDPRNILRKGTSAITDGVAYGGAFGDHISFEETETRMPNGSLRKKVGTGGNHGYFETVEGKKQEKVGKWCWNKRYGDQYSPEGTRMKREFVTSSASRPNTISLNACRLITRTLLWRSLNCVTNRAAMQIADETFSRAGCVPGILDALLMRSDAVPQDIHSTAQLKASLQTSRASFVDVTHQVMLCYEDTMDRAAGSTALFPPIHGVSNYSLSALEISDPCPGQLKVLWVRYVRAGDGQRRNARIQVERDGTFAPQNLAIDMDEESQVSKIQMSVTKEEFVGCILSSPLLSESLRQFSAADNDMTNVKSDTTGINLDVIIADPMAEAEDEDFLDALNVRQRIFFEVWDKDYTSRDDFLGECFLPPLNLLSEDPKMFVLPLTDCPHTDDRTMTRPYERKLAPKPGSAVGNLFVEASWKFPFQALEEIGEQDDIQTRVKKEEALHTGQLTLKIVKASGLRSADVRRQAGSDPYVMVYCRNETLPDKDEPNVPGIGDGGWRTDPKTGFHKCLMRTGVKHGTVNPEWGESQALMLQTGAFERRTNRSEWRSVIGSFDITGRSKKFQNDDHALDVLHGRQEGSGMGRGNQRDVRIYFGGADLKSGDKNIVLGQTDGYRHDVKVYMTDSIFQFKKKIMKACELEVKYMDDNRKKVAPDVKKRASYVQLSRTINYRHAVMVFVPSQKLREFAQQQRENAREYRRLYRLEEQDPNSWQPLDQIRDFDSYKAQFGFGMDVPQRLRVTEGTEEYKTKNARYKQFAEEQSAWRKRVHSLNNEEECFGYAKYKHPYDGNSTEWRQAIIDRPDAPPGEVRKVFKTWFIHSPAHTMPGQAIAPGQALKEELEETEVLLAPANPRLYTTRHLEHFEFLAQAYNLREKEHLTDQAIAARFNKEMKEKYAKERQYGETAAPAEITVRDVQHALRSGGGMRKNDSSSSIGIEDVSAAARPRRVSVTHH
uniref:C2 domain-containing protein n=1 Tax=Zooxanthella nutricula TaxID=1333877 RepID=A0A7S2HGN2_9DINO